MDLSLLSFDEDKKTITIEDISPRQTVEAIKELIKRKKIDPLDFQHAHLSYKAGKGPIFEFTTSYSAAPYHTVMIRTINLKKVAKEVADYEAAECAIEILRLLHLFMFDYIEELLKEPEDYIQVSGGGYNINIDKNGSLVWNNPYGSVIFITD